MKPLTIISLGACLMFIMLGFGGCYCLVSIGDSLNKPKRLIIEMPGLMKEKK